jgi:NADPH:quinone reductase-like Zn-dependent oxidoreductase
MTTMKAVCMHAYGGPEVLKLEEIEMPEPADDEVLVRVRAAGVNPIDYKVRSGAFSEGRPLKEPLVLGRDVAGTVERCGRSVHGFKPGDRIFAMLDGGPGGYAQYVAIKADLCAPEPRGLDHITAAAVPLAGLTAWQGLFDEGHLEAGQRVLVHGGAGGVGHLAIQLARAKGARVSTTVAGEDAEFARSLGADQVVDYQRERFEDKIHDVDLVLDLIAGETQLRSWAVLKEGGALVSTLTQPSQEKAREHHARGSHYRAHPSGSELAGIGRLIDAGKVKPRVTATYPLEQAAAAQERIAHQHVQGKVVLQIA